MTTPFVDVNNGYFKFHLEPTPQLAYYATRCQANLDLYEIVDALFQFIMQTPRDSMPADIHAALTSSETLYIMNYCEGRWVRIFNASQTVAFALGFHRVPPDERWPQGIEILGFEQYTVRPFAGKPLTERDLNGRTVWSLEVIGRNTVRANEEREELKKRSVRAYVAGVSYNAAMYKFTGRLPYPYSS